MTVQGAPLGHLADDAKRAIVQAQRTAVARRSAVIGVEHLILGTLAVKDGRATRAVVALAGSRDAVADALSGVLTPGVRPSPTHIPFAAQCEEAFALAGREAVRMGDDTVDTGHILLGVLAVDAPVARALATLGVDYDAARAQIDR